MVSGACGPLLLALGQVGPWEKQHVGQGSAHKHLGLGERPWETGLGLGVWLTVSSDARYTSGISINKSGQSRGASANR